MLSGVLAARAWNQDDDVTSVASDSLRPWKHRPPAPAGTTRTRCKTMAKGSNVDFFFCF